MPIYEFRCSKCQKDFDQLCSFRTDLSTITCPDCQGSVTKKISAFSVGGKSTGQTLDVGDHSQSSGGSGCGSCSSHSCGTCSH